jgi:prevent-host-death family protein
MKPNTWQLQNAKNRFSQLVDLAAKGEPQLVTKNNRPVVYIIDVATYEKKIQPDVKNKKAVLLSRPHKEILLDLSRDREAGREVDL